MIERFEFETSFGIPMAAVIVRAGQRYGRINIDGQRPLQADRDMVEFYDLRYPALDPEHRGQFMARFDLAGLLVPSVNGLVLDRQIPAWRIDPRTYASVQAWMQGSVDTRLCDFVVVSSAGQAVAAFMLIGDALSFIRGRAVIQPGAQYTIANADGSPLSPQLQARAEAAGQPQPPIGWLLECVDDASGEVTAWGFEREQPPQPGPIADQPGISLRVTAFAQA